MKDILHEGENEMRIIFRSPLKYIAEAYKKYGNIGNDDTYEGFMHLRKAHYMFGWDWGAHLPDAGIFRQVSLLVSVKPGLTAYTYSRATQREGSAFLFR